MGANRGQCGGGGEAEGGGKGREGRGVARGPVVRRGRRPKAEVEQEGGDGDDHGCGGWGLEGGG